MIFTKKTWLLCLALLYIKQIFGQDSVSTNVCSEDCCSKDLSPAGIMISHIHQAKEWMFSYQYEYMDMRNVYMGSNLIGPNDVFNRDYLMSPEKMSMNMHMLMAMYGLNDKITIMGMAHYMTNSMNMTMLPGAEHVMVMKGMPDMVMNNNFAMNDKASGLGDVQLSMLYSMLEGENHHLLLNLGLSLPIGQINIAGNNGSMYNGQHMPYSMQMGTGTVDVLPGFTYSYRKEQLNFGTQLQGVIHNGYNQTGYRYGNEAVLNTWLAYKWSSLFSSSLRLEGTASGTMKGIDASLYSYYEPAANPLNYGGKQVHAYAGLNFFLPWTSRPSYKVGVEYGKSLYRNFNGIQMDTRNVLYLNASFTI